MLRPIRVAPRVTIIHRPEHVLVQAQVSTFTFASIVTSRAVRVTTRAPCHALHKQSALGRA
jgi:hypothetical protein